MPEAHHLPRMGGDDSVPWGISVPTQVSQLSRSGGEGFELVGLLSRWSQEVSWVGLFAPWKLASATSEQPHPHLWNNSSLTKGRNHSLAGHCLICRLHLNVSQEPFMLIPKPVCVGCLFSL